MPKVTRKGGGAALPWKRDLFARDRRARRSRRPPDDVPVTVKMRKGIDDDHLTYLDAGRIAEEEGVAAVALHARTAAQRYSGTADWAAIAAAQARPSTSIPVLGNGDIWAADDALRMVARDRLRRRRRRPRLPRPAVAVRRPRGRLRRRVRRGSGPTLGRGRRDDAPARRAAWPSFYGERAQGLPRHPQAHRLVPQGLPGRADHVRHPLALVESLAALDDLLAALDPGQPWPGEPAEGQRGRAGSPRTVALPEGWLDSQELNAAARASVAQAELSVSGG